MSPEERAAECFNDPEWMTSLGFPPDFMDPSWTADERWTRIVAKAIRAAENEALERAAKSVALMGWTIVGGVDVASVEARILALKSKPPEGK